MTRLATTPLLLAALAGGAVFALGRPPAHAAHTRAATSAWPPLRSAGEVLVDDLRAKVAGRWNVAWQSLYPAHRRVASEPAYVSCEKTTPFPVRLGAVLVLSVRRGPVAVAGLTRTVPGVAVRVRLELDLYGSRDPIVVAHTFHLVPVGGRWTWILSPDRYRLYRSGACGIRLTA
jgi:hypothetical protein